MKNQQNIIGIAIGFICAVVVLGGVYYGKNSHRQKPKMTSHKTTPAKPQSPEIPNQNKTAAVRKLSLQQAIGQRIIYSYNGYNPPPQLEKLIRRGEVGGIIIFKRNISSPSALSATLHQLQSLPRPAGLEAPLLIMVDQEGGKVKRLPGPPEHSPQAIGRTGSAALAKQEGINTGRYLRSHGINVNLAPVVDVGRPGTYEERSQRSYGRNAELVTKMTAAFSSGLLQENVTPCFKHFPGLGLEMTDEDYKLNLIKAPLAELTKVDELPFTKANSQCMIMTSTGRYPALDDSPALFSKRIVTQELRDTLKFRGVSITDDLDVPALRPYGSATERGRKSIEAGNDLLLYCSGMEAGRSALKGLTKLYQMKKLDRDALYSTTERILLFRESTASVANKE